MQKFRVEITETAESDIQEIIDYIAKDNASSATRWIEEIEHQISSLEKFPLRCSVIDEAQELGREYRHLVYGDYRTIFRVDRQKVIILRVIHGARLLDMQTFER